MTKLHLRYVHQFRDRHGHLRFYFRKRGKRIPLPGMVGSQEFNDAYAAALSAFATAVANAEIGSSRTLPGTIGALVVSYYRSADWEGLSRPTKKNRRPILDRFREKHGSKQIALLTPDHLQHMMALIPNVFARRMWLMAIRALLQSAIPLTLKINPTTGLRVKTPKTDGHHTWSAAEIEQYRVRWPPGTQQRLVLEFALEAVSRRCEVVRLGLQHVRNGRIVIARAKGSKDVDIPMSPELERAILAMPKTHLTFVVTEYGKPRSIDGLGNVFAQWATQAGLPKQCRLHGLKKGGMTRLAESGATAHELMAISGHKTLSQVQLYTADADRRKLADSGMRKRISNEEVATPGTAEWQPKGKSIA